MNVDGRWRNVRVDARVEGVVVGVFTVAPGKSRTFAIDVVHMGNTFPPGAVGHTAVRPHYSDGALVILIRPTNIYISAVCDRG